MALLSSWSGIWGSACHSPSRQASEENLGASTGPTLGSATGGASAVKETRDQINPAAPPPPAPRPFVDEVAPQDEKYAELSTAWGALQVIDLGPAASAAATPQGVVFVTRDDRVVIASAQGKNGLQPVDLPAEAFSKYGFGPAVSRSHVYWASQRGQLMRASLKTRASEPLFDHARPNSRTSVQTAVGRDVVAFIAEIDQRRFAYIWASPGASNAEVLDASADGHEATSVALVHGLPHPRLVVLEGRTSMSPVHARTVRVTTRRVILDPNEVAWIGPGSHELTEIHAIDTKPGHTIAFLPTQRDFNGFGLAQLFLDRRGGEAQEPQWQLYPNGLDPAPLTAGHFCNKEYVLYVRPSEKRPRSPQELHIAQLSDDVPGEGEVLVRSRAFNDVSVAQVPGGALLVWTADRRTWGVVLSCPRSA
jgi:hypothetical protein